jgi:hypothetical protein
LNSERKTESLFAYVSLWKSVIIPPDCEYVCALGAALLGLKRLQMSSQADVKEQRPAAFPDPELIPFQKHTLN